MSGFLAEGPSVLAVLAYLAAASAAALALVLAACFATLRTSSSVRWRLSAIHSLLFLAQSAATKWWLRLSSRAAWRWHKSISQSASQVDQEAYILDHVMPILPVERTWLFVGDASATRDARCPMVFEIGAFDGLRLSNTLVFEGCGYNVVHIEGNPASFEELQRNRPRCRNVRALCSDHEGETTLTIAGSCSGIESTLTGYSREKKLKKFSNAKDVVLPLRRTQDVIDAVLETHGEQTIDVAFLDVEGHEVEVLNGLDWARTSPSCWCVEFCETSTPSRLRQIDDMLVSRGYLCVHEFAFGVTAEHRGSKSCDRLYVHRSLLWTGRILSLLERAVKLLDAPASA
jgi:FkbM family methyltransferase